METTCPRCGTGNRPTAKFCLKCVAALQPTAVLAGATTAFDDERTRFATGHPDAVHVYAATELVDRAGGPDALPAHDGFLEHALPDGTVIEGFQIVRTIGEGGFGIVYLAWDAALERHVAIKEYMPSSLARRASSSLDVTMRSQRCRETFGAGLRSFVNEARLLARFDHPALVKVFRFWEAHQTAYMAMPYYEGPTLKDALAQRPGLPSEAQLRAWLHPMLDALTVIHREQCYHRDISPDNILLTPGGPLLLDFGAARRVITDMTQALTAVLKPGFAPVEQYGGGMAQGPWTDLYALAGVVFYAITRRPPLAAAVRGVNDTVRPLAETHAGHYGDTFLRAIDAALAVRPEARPQDVQAFRALLDGQVHGASGNAVPAVAASAASAARTPAPLAPIEPTVYVPRADASMARTMRMPQADTATAPTMWVPRAGAVEAPDATDAADAVSAGDAPGHEARDDVRTIVATAATTVAATAATGTATAPAASATTAMLSGAPVQATISTPAARAASAGAGLPAGRSPGLIARIGFLRPALMVGLLAIGFLGWTFVGRAPVMPPPDAGRAASASKDRAPAPAPEIAASTAPAATTAPTASAANAANAAPAAGTAAAAPTDVPATEAPPAPAQAAPHVASSTHTTTSPASATPAAATKRAKAPAVLASATLRPEHASTIEAAPAPVGRDAPRPARCTDLVLKASLERLDAAEAAYLKKECR